MSRVEGLAAPAPGVIRRSGRHRAGLMAVVAAAGALCLLAAGAVGGALLSQPQTLGDALLGGAPAPPRAAGAPSWARPVVTADQLVDRVGVRVVQVAVTGGGGLIDLRYQVVDPERAAAIHDPATPPALVDEQTLVVANEPLMGHTHTGTFTAGQTYYVVFENPGNLVQPGGSVSVLLGDTELDHVPVR